MKKLIALLIAVMMIATMIPVMAVSTSAAGDGDWTTWRFATEYPSEDDDDDDEEKTYKPAAGYTYTDEGFTIDPADFTDTTPAITVQTKDKVSVKDGIYLQFRIDDYSYAGEDGTADQWIAPALTTDAKVAPGSSKYGGGWLTLIRGTGNGSFTSLPHLTDPATEEFGGTFTNVGSTTGTAPLDDDGREIYTLEITYENDAYKMVLNGVEQPGADQTTALLNKLDANGEFYLSINVQSGVKSGQAAITILKYGNSADNATTPTGDDSAEPEANEMVVADIAPADSIEANKPAILWSPKTIKMKGGNNINFTVQGDDTWKAVATDAAVFWQFSPKKSWSYAAEDFPVFGILLRDFWMDGGNAWYCAGEIMTPQNDCQFPFSIYDGAFFGEDEEYVFIPIDFSELWDGRINCVRLDLAMNDESNREFEICFAGMFRSEAEALAYTQSWLADNTDVATGVATDAPTEPEVETDAPTDAATDAPTADEGEQGGDDAAIGCASVVSMGAVAILAAAAAAVALKKKD